MFSDCISLSSLDLSSFDTSLVSNMSNMFRNCLGLSSLDITNFDVSQCTSFENMFENDYGLVLYINASAKEKIKNDIPSYINVSEITNNIYF